MARFSEYFMENVFNEMEMMSSPLAESEDSLISEMSTRNDFARASYLEYKAASRDGDDEMEYFFPPPPVSKDYSRLRHQLYRKKNEEYYMPRSKSYDRSDKYQKNVKKLINEKKKSDAIYAIPQKRKPLNDIEEFAELPKYVKSEASTSTTTPPTLELGTEIEFSSKVAKVEEKLKALKLAREDSLSNLLKKHITMKTDNEKKEEVEEKDELPGYVEPKDPIIKELQEFLNIEPVKKTENVDQQKSPVQSSDHKLIVKDWQSLMKSPSQSTTSSTTSTTTTTV